MRIGIDFDNTIVSYGNLFSDVASSLGLISPAVPMSKDDVRRVLRDSGREDEWTRVQGIVYGEQMCKAVPFPGATEFLEQAAKGGHECFIISHKTRHPVIGDNIDLHEVARQWLNDNGIKVPAYFELTQPEKAARIIDLSCEVFIDDLPEFLFGEVFPKGVKRILFDPEGNFAQNAEQIVVCSWEDVTNTLIQASDFRQ